MVKRPLVSVIDDDESVRESLPGLLQEFGYGVYTFSSAEELLASDDLKNSDCLIVDISMRGMSGPELHRELRRRGYDIPIIFITGQRDKAASADGQDVVACLFKPFSDTALLKALEAALRTK